MTQKKLPEKIYHIYARGNCIYHSLREEEFNHTWIALNRLADLLSENADLSYEEILVTEKVLEASY